MGDTHLEQLLQMQGWCLSQLEQETINIYLNNYTIVYVQHCALKSNCFVNKQPVMAGQAELFLQPGTNFFAQPCSIICSTQ